MIPISTSIPTHGPSVVVVGLILVNVGVFMHEASLPPAAEADFLYRFSLIPALFGLPDGLPRLLRPDLWFRLVSNTFLHAGLVHLVVNMWTLWLFGGPLQERLGGARFLAFYLVCGALASGAHLAFNLESRVPALGASGAIAGVLGAYMLLFPRARIRFLVLIIFYPLFFSLPAVVYAPMWFALQLLGGTAELMNPGAAAGIAWWAHIGGFVAGIGLAKTLAPPPRRAPPARRGPWG